MTACTWAQPPRVWFWGCLIATASLVPVPGLRVLPQAWAQSAVFGSPGVLNNGAEVDQSRDEAARIATDGRGVWLALWQSSSPGTRAASTLGSDADILFVRSGDNGSTWSAPAPVSALAAHDQGQDLSPALATDGKGIWIAVWSSTEDLNKAGRRDRDLQVAISSDNGLTWATPRNLNTNAGRDWGDDDSPDIATDGAGRWLVVWHSTDSLGNTVGGDGDVLVSSSTDAGLTWTAPAPIDKGAAGDRHSDDTPSLATDGRGHWVIAWSSGGPSADNLRYDHNILAAVSADNGLNWRDPRPVVAAGGEETRRDWGPRVVTDGLGHWLCGWSSTDSLGGRIGLDRDVLGARSNDGGATWSEPTPVNQEAGRDAGDDGSPQIVTDGLGSWVAVWTTWDNRNRSTGSEGDLAVAMSRDYGETWTTSQFLNTNAVGDYGGDFNPTLATDRNGLWMVVWDTNESEGGVIGADRDLMVVSGHFGTEAAGPPAPPLAR